MLSLQVPRMRQPRRRGRESGIVLLVVIVVLAGMSLAAIGLMRSSLTGNRIAGNLAFQQSATQSADAGIETAVAWLETMNSTAATKAQLNGPITAVPGTFGYAPTRADPAPTQTWESWWTTSVAVSGQMNTLPVDAAGNTVQFMIHRLCANPGAPNAGGACAVSPVSTGTGGSKGAGIPPIEVAAQVYYRITARVVGPRNTVSFVQAVVAL